MAGLTVHAISMFSPKQNYLPADLKFWYNCLFRQVFSLCFAYLFATWLEKSYNSKDQKCMTVKFLESRFWIPLSKISYGFYMFHCHFIIKSMYERRILPTSIELPDNGLMNKGFYKAFGKEEIQ